MKNVKIQPKLEANLRKLKVLMKFREEANKGHKMRGDKYVILTLSGAFVWNESKEGFMFWNEISSKIEKLNEGEKQ